MRSLAVLGLLCICLDLFGCRSGVVEISRHTRGNEPAISLGEANHPYREDVPRGSSGTVGIVSCAAEYDQFSRNIESTVSLAKKLEMEARITSKEAIQIDQDAALLSARYNNACNFFIHRRISFSEYRQEIDKAHTEYVNLRKFLLEKTP